MFTRMKSLHEDLASTRDMKTRIDVDQDLVIQVEVPDRTGSQQSVSKCLALRHGRQHDRWRHRLPHRQIELQVKDEGPGISPEHPKETVRAFHGLTAREAVKWVLGLGLAIAELHRLAPWGRGECVQRRWGVEVF